MRLLVLLAAVLASITGVLSSTGGTTLFWTTNQCCPQVLQVLSAPLSDPATESGWTTVFHDVGSTGTSSTPQTTAFLDVAMSPEVGRVYWANGNEISSALSAGEDSTTIVSLTDPALVVGLAYDSHSLSLFFTESYSRTIQSVSISGVGTGSADTLVSTVGTPQYVAVDGWYGGHIYWTERLVEPLTFIRRANLDGTGVSTLVQGVGSPSGIAVDPRVGFLYWADRTDGLIRRSTLTGADITDVTPARAAGDLFLDQGSSTLFFVEVTSSDTAGSVVSVTLSGTGTALAKATLLTASAGTPLAVTTNGFAASPSSTPSPTATPSMTASATASASAGRSKSPTPSHTPSHTQTPSPTPTHTKTPTPTQTPSTSPTPIGFNEAKSEAAESGSVLVKWAPYAGEDGSQDDLASYTIYVYPGNFNVTASKYVTELQVDELDPDTEFRFEVVANLNDGTEHRVSSVTAEPVPGDDGLLSFTWVAGGLVIGFGVCVLLGLIIRSRSR